MDTKGAMVLYRSLDKGVDYLSEDLKIEFAVNIERMMSRININKSELANRIHSSPAYITKVLRGDANPTIETMVKLTNAVEGALHIHIAPKSAKVRWFNLFDKVEYVESQKQEYKQSSSRIVSDVGEIVNG